MEPYNKLAPPMTPLKTPIRPQFYGSNSYGPSSSSSSSTTTTSGLQFPQSASKPTPEQYAFNSSMFSEKKKNQYQTPKCPSPPLKSTPASRQLQSNVPLIHHISSLSTFSPTLTEIVNNNQDEFSCGSFNGSNSINSNNSFSNSINNNNNNQFKSTTSPVNHNNSFYNSINNSNNSSNNNNNNNISLFDKNFEIQSNLGRGSFSVVYKVKSKFDGQLYAVKQARHQFRGFQERERAVREVKTAVSLPPHQNVLQYYSSWEQNSTLYIQTELCENGSLQDFLESISSIENLLLSEELIWNFLLDICLGIQHIHSYNMLHLDIKPENLYISSQGNIKIGDFGMAVKLEVNNNNNNNNNNINLNNNGNGGSNSNNTSIDSDYNNLSLDEDDIFFDFIEGDSRYLAPEFLNNKKLICKPSDIFSIGVTFFEIVTGKEMPSNGQLWELLRNDKANEFLEPSKYSIQLYQIICEMMKSTIQDRIQLDIILAHPNIKHIQENRRVNENYCKQLFEPYLKYQQEQRNQFSNQFDQDYLDNDDDDDYDDEGYDYNNNNNNNNNDIDSEYLNNNNSNNQFNSIRVSNHNGGNHFLKSISFSNTINYSHSSSSLLSDDDDSSRDSPIHFNLNNNNNHHSNNNLFSTIHEELNNNNNNNNMPTSSSPLTISALSSSTNNLQQQQPRSNTPINNKLFNNISSSNNLNSSFYGVQNNSSNNLLSNSGEYLNSGGSMKKKLGKRGLENSNNGSNSKSFGGIGGIKRSFESQENENNNNNNNNMSPRNLLSLFQETN